MVGTQPGHAAAHTADRLVNDFAMLAPEGPRSPRTGSDQRRRNAKSHTSDGYRLQRLRLIRSHRRGSIDHDRGGQLGPCPEGVLDCLRMPKVGRVVASADNVLLQQLVGSE